MPPLMPGEHQSFHEELQQDAAIGGAQSFAKTDLARALRNRYQHDVDHANRAQTKRHQADRPQERVHGIGDFPHHLGAFDGIPIVECIRRLGIEVMVSCNDGADGFLRFRVLLPRNRLVGYILDRLRISVTLHREIDTHRGVRHEQAHVLVVVVPMPDLLHRPNHLERYPIDEQRAAYRRMAREQYVHEFVSNHADIVALAFVLPIQRAPLRDWLVANTRELRFRAVDIPIAAAIFAHQTEVPAVDHRRGITHERRAANIQIVLVVQVILARRKLAATHRRHPPIENL